MAEEYSERNDALARAIKQMTQALEVLDAYEAHQGAAYLDMALLITRRELGVRRRRRGHVLDPTAAERLAGDFLHCNGVSAHELAD